MEEAAGGAAVGTGLRTAGPPLHVCFVHHTAYPLFNPGAGGLAGGAELQLYLMATELASDSRFRVSFVVASEAAPERERREGVEIWNWRSLAGPAGGRKGPADHLRYLRLLGRIAPDVLVLRGAGASAGLFALWCRLRGARLLYMAAHDSDLEASPPPWWPGGLYGTAQWLLHRLGLRLASEVVLQHERQRTLLEARCGRRGQVRPSAHRMPERPEAAPERFLLWVARCEPWKRPEVFLDLARRHPGERFVMVCPPARDAAYAAGVRRAAAALPNVEFLDFVPWPAIEDRFGKAWVFVNTSRTEGFPNTFVQAWKHGTPVLSLEVDPEGALSRGGAGICCGSDVAELSRAAARLLAEPGLRAAFSARAFAYAREHHDLARCIGTDKRLLLALARKTRGA